MRWLLVLCVLATAARADKAAKPTKEETAKLVAKWFDAIDGTDDLTAVAALTASSFTFTGYDENNDSAPECKFATATTPEKIKAALKCMSKHQRVDKPSEEEWKKWDEWSAKVAKKSMVGIKRQKAKLDKLAKTSTLLTFHMDCAGSESQVLVGATNENGTLKINAVLVQSIFCGE